MQAYQNQQVNEAPEQQFGTKKKRVNASMHPQSVMLIEERHSSDEEGVQSHP